MQRIDVALRRRLVEAGISQEPCDATVAKDAHPLHAVRIAGERLAVGVGEAPAALLTSGERAGVGSPRDRTAGEFADRGVGLRRTGKLAIRLGEVGIEVLLGRIGLVVQSLLEAVAARVGRGGLVRPYPPVPAARRDIHRVCAGLFTRPSSTAHSIVRRNVSATGVYRSPSSRTARDPS